MNTADFAELVSGFIFLRAFHFNVEPETGNCTLVIELAESEFLNSPLISLEFSKVSNLALKDFGGGATQLLCLRLESIAYQQLDQVNYFVNELERGVLSFFCQDCSLTTF